MENKVNKAAVEVCTKENAKARKNSKVRVVELKSTKSMKSASGGSMGCVPCFGGTKKH